MLNQNSNRLDFKIIDDIRRSVRIVDVIGHYIKLQKKGNSYFGLCPFHPDKHPSLSVSPSKNVWKCFVCDAKGSVFDFVSKIEKCSFIDAVKKVAEISNYDISNISFFKKNNSEQFTPKQKRILLANERLGKFFHDQLLLLKANAHALNYLKSRGLDEEVIKKFKIGYAVNDKNRTIDFLTNKNNALLNLTPEQQFNEQELLDAGIATVNSKGEILPLLIDRITFPIYDANNNLVAFSGRDLSGKADNKYLHTKATEVFDKSKILYNFNRVNFTNNDDTLIICEGFMDCIAYNRAGYTNCVATMGTQITQNHVYLLKSLKFVKTIILSFDNDNAGTIANINNAKFLIDNGYNVTIANYQDFQQKDIDEIILKNGIDAAKKVIEEREDFVSFLIRKKLSIKQPVDKVKNAVDDLIEDIISYGNKMLKNQYFKSIAQLANYDLEEIEKEFNKKEQNALSYKQTNYNYSKSYKHQNNNYSSKTNVATNDEMINEIQKAILDFNNNYEHSLESISLLETEYKKKSAEVSKIYKKITHALSQIIIQSLFIPQAYVPYVNNIAFNSNEKYDHLLLILKFIDNEIGKNNNITSNELIEKLKRYLDNQSILDPSYKKSLTWFNDKFLQKALIDSIECKKKKEGEVEKLMKDNVNEFVKCKYQLYIIQIYMKVIENEKNDNLSDLEKEIERSKNIESMNIMWKTYMNWIKEK